VTLEAFVRIGSAIELLRRPELVSEGSQAVVKVSRTGGGPLAQAARCRRAPHRARQRAKWSARDTDVRRGHSVNAGSVLKDLLGLFSPQCDGIARKSIGDLLNHHDPVSFVALPTLPERYRDLYG
jgi:hypothetical protein